MSKFLIDFYRAEFEDHKQIYKTQELQCEVSDFPAVVEQKLKEARREETCCWEAWTEDSSKLIANSACKAANGRVRKGA